MGETRAAYVDKGTGKGLQLVVFILWKNRVDFVDDSAIIRRV